MGQEWLGPSYFFISLVLGPLNSLLGYVPQRKAPAPSIPDPPQIPAALAYRTYVPRTQGCPGDTCPLRPSPDGPKNPVFCLVFCTWQLTAHDPGNQAAASAHDMGSGGLVLCRF